MSKVYEKVKYDTVIDESETEHSSSDLELGEEFIDEKIVNNPVENEVTSQQNESSVDLSSNVGTSEDVDPPPQSTNVPFFFP